MTRSYQGKSHAYLANLQTSLSLCLRQIQLPQGGSQPSLSPRDISPRGRDEFGLCVRQKIRTGFLALPLGELAFAKQMTERAER